MRASDVLNVDLLRPVAASVDRRTRIAFCIALLANILAFFIFYAHFLIYDHGLRFPWVPAGDQWGPGRWFGAFFLALNYRADVPVLLPLLTSALSVLSGFLAVSVWGRGREPSLAALACTSVLASIYPAMLAAYFYTWISPLFAGAVFLSLLGLRAASSPRIGRMACGALLVLLGMATYQACLSVMATVFMGLVVLEVAEHPNGLRPFLREAGRTLLPRLIAMVLGSLFYALSLPLLGIRTESAYQLQTVSAAGMPGRFVEVAREAVASLFLTQPEFLPPLKWTLLAAVLLALLLLARICVSSAPTRPRGLAKLPALLLAAAGMLVATKALFLVSAEDGFWEYRLNLSLGFFYAFAFYVLLTRVTKPLLGNAVLLLCLFVILRYAQADLVRQGVMLRGQMHDLALANRILARIESLPDLDLRKPYILVRTGYPPYRQERLASGGHAVDRPGDAFDSAVVTGPRCPAEAMFLLGSRVRWKERNYTRGWTEKVLKARAIALSQGRKPWPHESSVFIHGDWIVVFM